MLSDSSPAFIVDAMLGSMARKLRIFGYDTVYFRSGNDQTLIAEASKEGRIIVTSDTALSQLASRKRVTAILISGDRDSQRFADLVEKANKEGVLLAAGEPRCAMCNGVLTRTRGAEARERLPPSVNRRHRTFYLCSNCGKFYWRGSHWARLRTIQRLLARKNTFNHSNVDETHDSDVGPGPHDSVDRSRKA